MLPESIDKRLLDGLLYGRANAQTSRELAHKFGIKPRKVRKICSKHRDDGYLIGSSNKGFFMIDDEEDAKITLHNLLPRATAIITQYRTLEGGIRKKFSQFTQVSLLSEVLNEAL